MRLADPQPFVIDKEERAVVDNRSAKREAELVLLVGSDRAVGIVEEILGIQFLVAQEFVSAAVKAGWCRT